MCDQEKEAEEASGITCKAKEEIYEWLKQKYMLTFTNQIRFRLEEFSEGKIVKESRTTWIPINTQLREEIMFEI